MKKQQHREKEQTVSFRMTREDLRRLNAKVIVSGLPRTEYMTRIALQEGIHIFVERFESDRLGVELKKLRRQLESLEEISKIEDTVKDCIALLEIMIETERGEDGPL